MTTEIKKGLDAKAYVPLKEGETYKPYVPAEEDMAEFTFKAVGLGIVFGVIFGAANAYLGLRAGLTISTSIPVAVMAVAVFKILSKFGIGSTILETNIAQTTGSASSSLASGVIFTLPALFMWGVAPDLLQMTILAMSGGVIGILFMIPLRKFLIEREHGKLPYPEGTACAEVLVANEVGGNKAKYIFYGMGVAALFKTLTSWIKVIPDYAAVKIPFLKKGVIGVDLSAALFGVGYILGPRIAWVMVGGGLLSAIIIIPAIAYWGDTQTTPFFPETVKLIADMSTGEIWSRYVRYIGAGAVATAGIITLMKSIPVMIQSFKVGAKTIVKSVEEEVHEDKQHKVVEPRTHQDLPIKVVFFGILAVILMLTLVPGVFGAVGGIDTRLLAAICVAVFAFFFVTVAARIVGLVGVTSNPTSGMTIAALLGTATIFLAMGWTDTSGKAATLIVGCVVAIAASISGDTSQDLKSGYLLGATPRKQQMAELIGVLTSATFVCLSVLLLAETFGFGSKELPAPQATLMKLVIDGVLEQSLPWVLVAIGVGIAIVCELVKIPSLPFAVGVYLPLSTMTPILIGGLIRHWVESKTKKEDVKESRREKGILLGSGFVGGEGLLGVAIAGMAFVEGRKPDGIGTGWIGSDMMAMILGAISFSLLVVWFVKLLKKRDEA
ncbi:OPT family oligopeptide transporter [Kangiella koreensis]|uniref:Oligopeptide transporter, OPT family n=1 Tax=Kangiella koreensis (strain DSM 16069 / JCM 12317 / KCTC 12182 / SW-125) TaxID=523791 RepID=C7R908_KANKD|nr:oligopeptide transporter, OPT family [Kangiella koreensis]ACV27798.1 oligopeptide transporter, OPT family [Kangiella koreensis DSM 16069]